MTKEEKEKQVAWLRDQFHGVRAFFLTDFQGLTVTELNGLRTQLRNLGVNFKVCKNTLLRLAYQDTDVAVIGSDVVGPRAAAWTHTDKNVPALAKILIDFSKAHPKLELIRGVLDGKVVQPSEMEALSKLPSREELLGILLGTMKAPIRAFVNTLAAVPRSFLNVLKAIEDQRKASSESSAG
ncbi:MAG: 50S ribosomal protein L10 [Desulfomonile sp.]|nr:50S ribosomal protein L10 [Deltaproteobacteria bacterium]